MILSFKCSDTQELWEKGKNKKISPSLHRTALRKLWQLDNAESLDESHFHFIFKKGIEIIGIVHIEFFDETRAAIISMAIDFSYQNQGYGTRLLQLTEEWIRNQGRTGIQVHSNSRAVKFYEKFDYFVKYRLIIENESVLIKWLKEE